MKLVSVSHIKKNIYFSKYMIIFKSPIMIVCFQCLAGDMLVSLNDIDVTWVNIDDLFKALCSQQEVSNYIFYMFA